MQVRDCVFGVFGSFFCEVPSWGNGASAINFSAALDNKKKLVNRSQQD
jgi:hypothetical protein